MPATCRGARVAQEARQASSNNFNSSPFAGVPFFMHEDTSWGVPPRALAEAKGAEQVPAVLFCPEGVHKVIIIIIIKVDSKLRQGVLICVSSVFSRWLQTKTLKKPLIHTPISNLFGRPPFVLACTAHETRLTRLQTSPSHMPHAKTEASSKVYLITSFATHAAVSRPR